MNKIKKMPFVPMSTIIWFIQTKHKYSVLYTSNVTSRIKEKDIVCTHVHFYNNVCRLLLLNTDCELCVICLTIYLLFVAKYLYVKISKKQSKKHSLLCNIKSKIPIDSLLPDCSLGYIT